MDYREFARIARKNGHALHNKATVRALRRVHHSINERADMAACFAGVTAAGKVGYITDGMDCDGMQYHREGVMDAPRSLVVFQKEQDEHMSWLDGPETTYYVKPEDVDDGYYASRDRALEAFEDGHPHSLYMGPL